MPESRHREIRQNVAVGWRRFWLRHQQSVEIGLIFVWVLFLAFVIIPWALHGR